MGPFESSLQASAGTASPVHTVSLEVPPIDLAGDSAAGAERARDHGFVTATLERTLRLGRSSLALDEGTPWFGGSQGLFLAVAAGGRDQAASAQAATAAGLRALAGHATAVMPWIVAPDGEEMDDIEQELARSLLQAREVVQGELERLGIGERAALSAGVAF